MTHTHQDVQQKLPVAEILFTGFTIITTDGLNITSRPLSGTDMFLLCGYAVKPPYACGLHSVIPAAPPIRTTSFAHSSSWLLWRYHVGPFPAI